MKKLILIAALIAASVAATAAPQYQTRRVIEKSFPATASTLLNIDNRYGKVTIETWDRNEIRFTVTVTGTSPRSQAEADEHNARVTIDLSSQGDVVRALTTVKSQTRSMGGGFKIEYLVRVPRGIEMEIRNHYGDVEIDRCGGSRTKFEIKYGDLTCGTISDAKINLEYGNAHLGPAGNLKIYLRYGKMYLETYGNLTVDSKYGEVNAEGGNSIHATSAYDRYNIERAADFQITGAYTKIKVGAVAGSISVTAKYGGVEVKTVEPTARELTFGLDYTDLLLGIPAAMCHELRMSVSYGKLSMPLEGIMNYKGNMSATSQNFTGQMGQGTPTMKLTVTSRYGNIKIATK